MVTIYPFEDGNGRTARLMTGYILDYYGYGFNGIGSFHNSIINGIIETLKSGLTEENNGTVPTDYIYSDFNISNNIICDIHSQENKLNLKIPHVCLFEFFE